MSELSPGSTLEKKPRKRRRRQKQDDEYDLSDAFIDDSTANIDAPTHQGVPVREGFYVHEGAITLKEAEAYVVLLVLRSLQSLKVLHIRIHLDPKRPLPRLA